MAKYIDIFTDYGFKRIFGEEANKNFLIDFLNSLLPNAHIKDLAFRNTEQLPVTIDERKAVYDIYWKWPEKRNANSRHCRFNRPYRK